MSAGWRHIVTVALPLLAGCVWTRQEPGRAIAQPGSSVQVFAAGVVHQGAIGRLVGDSLELLPGRWIRLASIDSIRVKRAHPVAFVVGFGVGLPLVMGLLLALSMKGCCA